jgi:BirA family biotin operon repressor/biotin-[acetyl-CoA-carboxylase] ligase
MTASYTSSWHSLEPTAPPARLGHPLRVYERLASTNDLLRGLAEEGASEGTTVVARHQTAGRGRQGRAWVSPAGKGLYLSVLLRPDWPARDAGWLAVLSGVGAARALERLGVDQVAVRWPNDVFAAGRKICGVLAEPRLERGLIEFAVLGIGINVRQGREDFPGALEASATSMGLLGVAAEVDAVGVTVLAALEETYGQATGGKGARARLFEEWKERGGLDLLPELA